MSDDQPLVVFSYGLGLDSTAILLRWLTEPHTRDFPLHNLICVTAHTGSEWAVTGRMVTEHVLPLMRRHQVRFIQVARKASQRDGVTVLEDTREPRRLHLAGDYTLAQEMFAGGTVPQSGGPRRCSARAKGWPLDQAIAQVVGGRPYRHVIGFEVNETRRRDKDRTYNTDQRTGEYPLIDWEWDRDRCADFVRQVLGVDFPKSACSFCPFSLASAAGRERTLHRFAEDPQTGVEALLMEHAAVSLNERQGLIAGRRLYDLIARTPGQARVLEVLEERLDRERWAVYEVQRILRPKAGSPDTVANGVRRVVAVANGSRAEMRTALGTIALHEGLGVDGSDVRHPRVWKRRRGIHLPAAEWFYTLSPATAHDKTGRGFHKAWASVGTSPQQMDIIDAAAATLQMS
jgi:hypothetical protein